MTDNRKFLAALALTTLLAAAAVWQSHRRQTTFLTYGEPVDLPRIERLMERGLLSDHPADYAAPLEGP